MSYTVISIRRVEDEKNTERFLRLRTYETTPNRCNNRRRIVARRAYHSPNRCPQNPPHSFPPPSSLAAAGAQSLREARRLRLRQARCARPDLRTAVPAHGVRVEQGARARPRRLLDVGATARAVGAASRLVRLDDALRPPRLPVGAVAKPPLRLQLHFVRLCDTRGAHGHRTRSPPRPPANRASNDSPAIVSHSTVYS